MLKSFSHCVCGARDELTGNNIKTDEGWSNVHMIWHGQGFLALALFVITITITTTITTTSKMDTDKRIEDIVSRYLSFWETKGGISSKGIDVLMKRAEKCHEFQRFEVQDGRLDTIDDPRCLHVQRDKFSLLVQSHISRIVPACGLTGEKDLNFQFVVNIKDEPNQLKTKVHETKDISGTWEAPLMSFQTTLDHLDIPIDYSRDDQALQRFVREEIMTTQSNVSQGKTDGDTILWNSKKPALFWRGSQTGGWYTVQNWKSFPRSKLVLLSMVGKTLVDNSFKSINKFST